MTCKNEDSNKYREKKCFYDVKDEMQERTGLKKDDVQKWLSTTIVCVSSSNFCRTLRYAIGSVVLSRRRGRRRRRRRR